MAAIPERVQAALSGRYQIERELGRGGMATVFLAEDLRHHRPVAIKVLDPELGALLGAERFLREIEIAARLSHPHILPLFDSGEAQGLLYYVMPFARGESLRQRLELEKQLPVEDAVRIAREVADALDYAQREGVVHRDIKPENILIAERHAVVSDFGIARAIHAAGGAKLTETGVALGTPAYMSPEQASGGALDHRSDQYALGCVLYEMLAGQPPYVGPTAESVTYQHLSAPPPRVTQIRASVAEALERAIGRALAKAPADRFGSAAEFAAALAAAAGPAMPQAIAHPGPSPRAGQAALSPAGRTRRWAAVAIGAALVAGVGMAALNLGSVAKLFHPRAATGTPVRPAWILVSEFDGPADDPTLAGAVRELVTAALDQSGVVATVPREQIRIGLQNAGRPDTTRVQGALARELAFRSAIRTVLEGSVSRVGRGYALVLRVVNADSGNVVQTVDGSAAGPDALIPEANRLARRLCEGLGQRQGAIQAIRAAWPLATPSFEAYRKDIQAVRLSLEQGDFEGGRDLFRQALALDPGFVYAWLGLGVTYLNHGDSDSARACYEEALRHSDREEERVLLQALLATVRNDLSGTLAAYDRYLAIPGPEIWGPRNNRALALSGAGRWEEALAELDSVIALSPIGPGQVPLLNRCVELGVLGRVNEGWQMVPKLTGRYQKWMPLYLSACGGEWSRAESLATALASHPATDPDLRGYSLYVIGAQAAARGELAAAFRTLGPARDAARAGHNRAAALGVARHGLYLSMASGAAVPPLSGDLDRDTTTAGLLTRGLFAAAGGRVAEAEKLQRLASLRSPAELSWQGMEPALLEAMIAAGRQQWNTTAAVLRPLARQNQWYGTQLWDADVIPLRWVVAAAHEHLGQPDSAAAYYELALRPDRLQQDDRVAQRLFSSFAHQRLVLLYTRLGRLEPAREHWRAFNTTFVHPDPELRRLRDEARAALAGAEAMARPQAQ